MQMYFYDFTSLIKENAVKFVGETAPQLTGVNEDGEPYTTWISACFQNIHLSDLKSIINKGL